MALVDKLANVVGAWHGNSDALDSSPNSNDIIRSGVTFDATNKKLGSHSFAFDGIDDDMRTTSIPLSDGSSFTALMWVRRTAVSSGTQMIISCFNGSSKRLQVFFRSGNNIRVVLDDGIAAIGVWNSTLTVADGSQHMVAIRYNQTDSMKFNIDGSQEAQIGSSANPDYALDPTSEFTFGATEVGGNRYGGNLDEIVLFNTDLTDAEITEYYNSGNGIEYPFTVVQAITSTPDTMIFSEVVGNVEIRRSIVIPDKRHTMTLNNDRHTMALNNDRRTLKQDTNRRKFVV